MLDQTRSRLYPLVLLAVLLGAFALAACGDNGDTSLAPAAQTVDTTDAPATEGFPQVVPLDQPLEAPSGIPEEIQSVWEVWALLTKEHVERATLDPEAFTEAAIRGMIQALGDPHTGYVRPESFSIQSDDLQGEFEGIGANVSMRRDGKLQIVSPLPGSPARAVGLKPGDLILEVNGESILGLSLLEAVALIRGPRGSEVRLLILHLGAIDPVEVSITRDTIPLISVLLRSEPGDKIAHIRLTSFYADTSEQLSDTIKRAVRDGAEGLIIDVRDNPGGLLSSAVDIVSQFVDDGLVVYEVDGDGTRKDLAVRKGGEATRDPRGRAGQRI